MSNESLSKDSLNTLSSLDAGGKTFHYYSLPKAADTLGDLNRLPFSLKVAPPWTEATLMPWCSG